MLGLPKPVRPHHSMPHRAFLSAPPEVESLDAGHVTRMGSLRSDTVSTNIATSALGMSTQSVWTDATIGFSLAMIVSPHLPATTDLSRS
jgi:hypothetical protein